MGRYRLVAIDSIANRNELLARSYLRKDTIAEYARAMKEGANFPPIVVFYDGTTYWLADGSHRTEAAQRIGRKRISAQVLDGTRRDATLFAVGANLTNGLRRSNADKQRAVLTLLDDLEWSQWSDRVLAAKAGVSHTFVAKVRARFARPNATNLEERHVVRGGNVYVMKVAKRTLKGTRAHTVMTCPMCGSQFPAPKRQAS